MAVLPGKNSECVLLYDSHPNNMKEVTLKIPDKEYNFFMKLVKNLGFVKVEKIDDGDSGEEIVENLKQGFKEMQLIKQGKLKSTPAKEFLNEL